MEKLTLDKDKKQLNNLVKDESLQETLELLSIPELRESLLRSLQQVQNDETYSLDEVLGE